MQLIKHWWSSISTALSIRVFFSNENALMASFCFSNHWRHFCGFISLISFLFSNKKHILILYKLAMGVRSCSAPEDSPAVAKWVWHFMPLRVNGGKPHGIGPMSGG